jgi:hypothetical protein
MDKTNPNGDTVREALLAARKDPLLRRIFRICDPGRRDRGAFTFHLQPEEDAVERWTVWLNELYLPHLLPRQLEIMQHAQEGKAREVREEDLKIDEILCDPGRSSSLRAGETLLKSLSEAQGVRLLNKMKLWHEAGRTPAHFATIYAMQSAIFSFPMRQALLCYLWHEWLAATWQRAEFSAEEAFLNSVEDAARALDRQLRELNRFVIFHDFRAKVS